MLLAALGGCFYGAEIEDPPGPAGGKADGSASCEDEPKYGDGTCQLDLGCGVPDIDCFAIYPDDEAASVYIREVGFATVPVTNTAYYGRAHTLLDRAWEMFRADVPVGRLADKPPAIVVVDKMTANAFIIGANGPGMTSWSVQIHSELLRSSYSDETIVSTLLHELTHAVRQHTVDEIKTRTYRFFSTDTPEVLGFQQTDRSTEHALYREWADAAELAGMYSEDWLDALPYDGVLASLFVTLEQRATYTQTGCAATLASLRTIMRHITARRLDGSITLPDAEKASLRTHLETMRSCASNPAMSFRALVDFGGPEWVEYVDQLMLADEKPLWTAPAFTAIATLTANRRATMRKVEARFAASVHRPWSSLRYFSTEEEADDYAVRIGKHHGVALAGREEFFLGNVGPDREACAALLAAGQPVAYGRNLFDAHHASCWRIAHGRQIAALPEATSRETVEPREPWTPTRVQVPTPIY